MDRSNAVEQLGYVGPKPILAFANLMNQRKDSIRPTAMIRI
jgi:hypothetical protein